MRVLCCLDGTNSAQIAKATEMLSQGPTLGLLHVIDTGPRRDMDRIRERFFRPKAHHLPHEKEMLESEKASAQDILSGARRCWARKACNERKAEREIVNAAAEWRADRDCLFSANMGKTLKLGRDPSGMLHDLSWITHLVRSCL
jgi:hypothetical protein